MANEVNADSTTVSALFNGDSIDDAGGASDSVDDGGIGQGITSGRQSQDRGLRPMPVSDGRGDFDERLGLRLALLCSDATDGELALNVVPPPPASSDESTSVFR